MLANSFMRPARPNIPSRYMTDNRQGRAISHIHCETDRQVCSMTDHCHLIILSWINPRRNVPSRRKLLWVALNDQHYRKQAGRAAADTTMSGLVSAFLPNSCHRLVGYPSEPLVFPSACTKKPACLMAAQWLQTYPHVCLSVGRPHAAQWNGHCIQGGSPRSVYLQVEKDPGDPLLVMQGIQSRRKTRVFR